jgi:Glutaredoxin-like domain (DUF836)
MRRRRANPNFENIEDADGHGVMASNAIQAARSVCATQRTTNCGTMRDPAAETVANMPNAPALELYGKEDCWLCEQAKELLFRADIIFVEISILGNFELRQRYGLRLPVLREPDTGAELNWPFDADSVNAWLAGGKTDPAG